MKIKIKKNEEKKNTENIKTVQNQKINKGQQKFKFSLKKEENHQPNEIKEILEKNQNQKNFEHDIHFEYQDDSQEFKNVMFNSEETENLLVLNQNEHILDLINQNQENNEIEIEYLKWMKMSNVEDFKEFLAHSPRFPNN